MYAVPFCYFLIISSNVILGCKICLNEINIDNSEVPEIHEFLELGKCGCNEMQQPSKENYMLLVLKEYEKQKNGPVIVLHINLETMKSLWLQSSSYFLIASHELSVLPDLSFSHPDVGFRKKRKRTRMQVDLGIEATSQKFHFEDVLENGNKAVMAVVLLQQKWSTSENIRNLFTQYKLLTGVSDDNFESILITNEIEMLIKENLVDVALYSRKTLFNSCSLFLRIGRYLDATKTIRIASEWDLTNHVEVSVNHCPKPGGQEETDFFMFTNFKLGPPTPKAINNCEGPHFELLSNIPTILLNTPFDTVSHSQRIDIPEACSSSTHVIDYHNLDEDAVVMQRDCVISKAANTASLDSCTCTSSDTNTLNLGDSVERLRDTIHLQFAENNNNRNEPVCNNLPSLNNMLIKPWEDSSHFKEKWLQDIKKYQGKFVAPTILTKERMVWLEYLSNNINPVESTFRCRFCFQLRNRLQSFALNRPLLSEQAGYFVANYKRMWKQLTEHPQSLMHKNAIMLLKDDYEASLKQCSTSLKNLKYSQLSTEHEITAKMMRTVYAEVKLNAPLNDHEEFVLLQKLNGLQLGSHHYERTSATRMMETISQKMHYILIEYIKKQQTPFSIVVDTATDGGNKNYFFIFLRALENYSPVYYFYRSLHVKSERAEALFQLLVDAFQEDGLYNSFLLQTVGFASDSAPVMIGSKGGLAALINNTVQSDVYTSHCAAHKLELAAGHAFEKVDGFKNKFEKFINSIYSFYYNKSFKCKETLMHTAEIMGEAFYELNYIFTIRWIPSEYQALLRIYTNYKILVSNMEYISQNNDFTKDIKENAIKLKKTLLHPIFFTTLSFALDVLFILKDVSLQLQKESGSVIGLEAIRVKLMTSIGELKIQNKKYLLHILENAKCYKDGWYQTCSLEDLDTCNYKLKFQGVDLFFDARQVTDILRRKNLHWPAISKLRHSIIENCLTQLKSYFPEGSFKIFDVLLPANLPSHFQEVAKYSLQIKQLAARFHMNAESISVQFSNLIGNIITNLPEQYCTMKTSDPVDFWMYFMKSPLIEWVGEIKQLITIVLTLSPTTAQVERAFSIMSHVLTNR